MRSILYVSDGKLFRWDGRSEKEIKSQVLVSYIDKLKESLRRTEWKRTGEGAKFTGAFSPEMDAEQRISSINSSIRCVKHNGSGLIYSISIDGMTGIYTKEYDSTEEGIVISNANTSYTDFDISNGRIAVSASFAGESHIGIMDLDDNECLMYTDGRSWDSEPVWSKTERDCIYFCTAGLEIRQGRDETENVNDPYARSVMMMVQQNAPVRKSPTSICLLDAARSEMKDVLCDDKYDFLHPQSMSDGSLYYIRRPYEAVEERSTGMGCLGDILLFPFRMIGAIFGFFNFFSIKYSGTPLSKRGSVKSKDEEKLFIDGNLISADAEYKKNKEKGDKIPGIIPRSWELRRLYPDGRDVLVKRGVVAYRVDDDTENIFYSNGSAVVMIDPDGKEEKVSDAKRVTFIL